MRALVVGDNDMRKPNAVSVVLRSGFECKTNDVTSIESAGTCAARARREITVLLLPPDIEHGMAVLRELRNTTQSVMLVVGPAVNPKLILRALREGADEYLDESVLDEELEAALVRIRAKRTKQADGGTTVGVLAAGGGCGASMLSANLATSLAMEHDRSALFDLRLAAGDQTLLLDMTPSHTLADLCRNLPRMDQIMFQQSLVRHASGAHLLAAPERFRDIPDVSPEGVRQALTIARSLFPFVVIDLDRSFAPEQVAAIMQSDIILLVVRLDITSLNNANRVLDYLHEIGVADDRTKLVVNRYHQPKELPVRQAEQALGMKVLHLLPNDPASVNTATNKGVPVVQDQPRAKVSKSLIELRKTVAKLRNVPQTGVTIDHVYETANESRVQACPPSRGTGRFNVTVPPIKGSA